MTAAFFWGCTPREYDSFKAHWEDSRLFQRSMYAGLQATLHNGLRFTPPNGLKGFTPDMWMPGYKAPVQTGADRAAAARLRHAFSQTMTPEQRAFNQQQHIDSQHRHERARKAKAEGASRETVIAIVEGRE